MRRDLLLIATLGTALLAILLGGASLLIAPPAPPDLLPPGSAIISVERRGLGRLIVVARLPPRQSRHHVYRHLVGQGWRLRRANVLPEDAGQSFFRRALEGRLLESAELSRDRRDGRTVTLDYYRCLRQITCGWR